MDAIVLVCVMIVIVLCLLCCTEGFRRGYFTPETFRRHERVRAPMRCNTQPPEDILTVADHIGPVAGAGRYAMIGPYYRAPSQDDARQRYPDAFGWRDSGRPGDPLEIQRVGFQIQKEDFGVCKDCDVTIPDREIPSGGFSTINPFIYPYSGSECLDEIQSISSTYVPLTHATTPDHVVLTN